LDDYDEIGLFNEKSQENILIELENSFDIDDWHFITISHQYGRHSLNAIRIWDGDDLIGEISGDWDSSSLSWEAVLDCTEQSPCA